MINNAYIELPYIEINTLLNIINYNFFAFIVINFFLLIIYLKIANKIGFVDKSKKFDNLLPLLLQEV